MPPAWLVSSATSMVTLLLCACTNLPKQHIEIAPISEKTLARRKLQIPLDQHHCKTRVLLTTSAPKAITLGPVVGRGPSYQEALEALCREADGLLATAVTQIVWYPPTSWSSSTHQLRATALRHPDGLPPPDASDSPSMKPGDPFDALNEPLPAAP